MRRLRASFPSLSGTLIAFASYALLTIILTWPLGRGLARDLPADFGDPLLNTWILAWDADHLLRALSGQFQALGQYWQANIYYPHPLALAYSEHLTAQAVMILPVHAMARNPILSYNVAFLSTFVLSAIGMFLFVRALTGSGRAAFLAGLAFGFAPYRFGTLPHLQVLSSMWMPFVLLGFHRFFETRRVAPLAGAAAAWLAQNLSCGYYLLFFSPALALYVALEITRRGLWSDGRMLSRVALAVAAVGIATAPFLVPYWQIRHLGFSPRSLAETTRYSADVLGYGTADLGMWLWGNIVRAWPKPEGSLFPGFTIGLLSAVALAHQGLQARNAAPRVPATWIARALTPLLVVTVGVTVAILLGWSLRVRLGGLELRLTSLDRGLFAIAALGAALLVTSPRARRAAYHFVASPVGTLTLVTGFSFAMSLGPHIYAHGRLIEERNVYSFFYDFVPGFDGLRVPARFAMVVVLGLAALAGCGAAAIARRRGGSAVIALAAALIIAESWAAPIELNVNSTEYKQAGLAPLPDRLPAPTDIPAVYHFVQQLPASSALIELPFGEVAFETRYMFYSTFHWRRLVNGYSGGGPDAYGLQAERLKEILADPEAAWQAVLGSRATHILVHEASYAGGGGRLISAWALAHGAREIGMFDTDRLLAIGP
ncbi:MAG: hypothetical protein ABJA98_03755 [Acidobacteriota bacterium]